METLANLNNKSLKRQISQTFLAQREEVNDCQTE